MKKYITLVAFLSLGMVQGQQEFLKLTGADERGLSISAPVITITRTPGGGLSMAIGMGVGSGTGNTAMGLSVATGISSNGGEATANGVGQGTTDSSKGSTSGTGVSAIGVASNPGTTSYATSISYGIGQIKSDGSTAASGASQGNT